MSIIRGSILLCSSRPFSVANVEVDTKSSSWTVSPLSADSQSARALHALFANLRLQYVKTQGDKVLLEVLDGYSRTLVLEGRSSCIQPPGWNCALPAGAHPSDYQFVFISPNILHLVDWIIFQHASASKATNLCHRVRVTLPGSKSEGSNLQVCDFILPNEPDVPLVLQNVRAPSADAYTNTLVIQSLNMSGSERAYEGLPSGSPATTLWADACSEGRCFILSPTEEISPDTSKERGKSAVVVLSRGTDIGDGSMICTLDQSQQMIHLLQELMGSASAISYGIRINQILGLGWEFFANALKPGEEKPALRFHSTITFNPQTGEFLQSIPGAALREWVELADEVLIYAADMSTSGASTALQRLMYIVTSALVVGTDDDLKIDRFASSSSAVRRTTSAGAMPVRGRKPVKRHTFHATSLLSKPAAEESTSDSNTSGRSSRASLSMQPLDAPKLLTLAQFLDADFVDRDTASPVDDSIERTVDYDALVLSPMTLQPYTTSASVDAFASNHGGDLSSVDSTRSDFPTTDFPIRESVREGTTSPPLSSPRLEGSRGSPSVGARRSRSTSPTAKGSLPTFRNAAWLLKAIGTETRPEISVAVVATLVPDASVPPIHLGSTASGDRACHPHDYPFLQPVYANILRDGSELDPMAYVFLHHVGTIVKRGHRWPSWRRRWFELNGARVVYYIDNSKNAFIAAPQDPAAVLVVPGAAIDSAVLEDTVAGGYSDTATSTGIALPVPWPLDPPRPPAHALTSPQENRAGMQHRGAIRGEFYLSPYSRAFSVELVGRQYCFCVTTADVDRPFICQAPTQGARDAWVRALQHNIRVLQSWERRKALWRAASTISRAVSVVGDGTEPSFADIPSHIFQIHFDNAPLASSCMVE